MIKPTLKQLEKLNQVSPIDYETVITIIRRRIKEEKKFKQKQIKDLEHIKQIMDRNSIKKIEIEEGK